MAIESQPIYLPKSVEAEAMRLAEKAEVSLDRWVAIAVMQKIGLSEPAEEFFRRRSQGVSGIRMQEILARAPNVPPMPGDELPEDLRAKLS